MGCVSSKIQHEDAVGQCEARKAFVKQAVAARTALAAAHVRYVHALAATSLAFKQFSDSELGFRSSSDAAIPSPTKMPPPISSPDEEEDQEEEDEQQSPSPASILRAISSSSEEIAEKNARVAAMMLRNTPAEAVTVVLSPPRRRSFTSENDYFARFVERDGDGGAASDERERRQESPPPAPLEPASNWEYFNIFHPPPPLLRRFQDIPSDDEDIPALESSEDEELKVRSVRVEEAREDGKKIAAKSDGILERDHPGEEAEGASSSSSSEDADRGAREENAAAAEGNKSPAAEKGEKGEKDQSGAKDSAAAAPPPPPAPVELVDVLRELEEQFLRASEAGKPVLRTLEAGKVHERGFSDHSSRLLSALSLGTWSPRSLSSPRSGFDIEAGGMSGSHAGTLDRLYAWEKKLYEEVKAWETVNMELERKRKLLRNLDARGAKPEIIDKTRASMKALETEITVAVHAMEASSQSIQKITDDEMLPQLLELLEGLAIMWKGIHECHQLQLNVVMHLKLPQGSALEAISVSHRNTTAQLETALTSWQTSLSSFLATQKDYVRSLSGWIKWSVPQETTSKKNGRKTVIVPKIRHMCDKWSEALEQLQLQALSSRMKELSETLREIGHRQAEEIRLQKRAETLSKELNKKMIALNSLEKKQMDSNRDGNVGKKSSSSSGSVDKLRERVEEEKQRFRGAIAETRSFTLCGLQSSLPPLFQELHTFTERCMETHDKLYVEVSSYTAGGDSSRY